MLKQIVGTVALLGISAAVSAASFTNGSFEAGSTATGWTLAGAASVYKNNAVGEYCCGLGGGVPEGTFAAAMGSGGAPSGSFSQAFNTILGAFYTGSLLVARVGPDSLEDQGIHLVVGDSTFDFDPVSNAFSLQTFSFIALDHVSTITFSTTTSSERSDVLFDNIQISTTAIEPPPTGAPEPASLGLFVVACLTAFVGRRRQRQREA